MLEDESSLRYLGRKVLRRWRWARSEGLGRLIEEDQLDPFSRVTNAVSGWRWRREQGVAPGSAVAIYVVGVQRSGTNMLVRSLKTSPEIEIHNENDRRAFHRFRLRSDTTIAAIVTASRHRYVLFKPLCDSHRADHLLDHLATPTPGAAIWVYRAVDGRVRSAVAKFGDVNLRVLAEIAAGRGRERWQAQRLSAESLELICSFDYSTMTPESAAALFWYVRNALYFELGLHERDDVMLSSYDVLVTDPDEAMRPLCGFLDLPWDPRLVGHIHPRTNSSRPPLSLDPRIRARCDALQERLDAAAAEKARAAGRRELRCPRSS